jgi:hypothetical protein
MVHSTGDVSPAMAVLYLCVHIYGFVLWKIFSLIACCAGPRHFLCADSLVYVIVQYVKHMTEASRSDHN